MARLVTGMLGATPGARLTRQIDAAGGDPLLVTELVGALLADGSVQIADQRAEIASVAPPRSH